MYNFNGLVGLFTHVVNGYHEGALIYKFKYMGANKTLSHVN